MYHVILVRCSDAHSFEHPLQKNVPIYGIAAELPVAGTVWSMMQITKDGENMGHIMTSGVQLAVANDRTKTVHLATLHNQYVLNYRLDGEGEEP